jgi:arsenate reductase
MISILHNPRCGKSREALSLLEATGQPFEVIKYLDNPLTTVELKILIEKLKLHPIDLVRQKEAIWIDKFKGRNLTDTSIIKAMADYPILIERPIIVNGSKAVIGRPIDKLTEIV